MDAPDLPDGTKQVAEFANVSPAYLTVERARDGAVYIVTWWHHVPTVRCVVRPDGTSWADPDWPD